ncbi:MAG: type II toxin-antitoxin system VapC family toxin [Chthonomonadales bacterium]
MKQYIIDTSAYSNYIIGQPGVVETLQEADVLFVNPITLAELRAGYLSGTRTAENESRLENFLSSPRVVQIDINPDTTRFYATIWAGLRRAGTQIPTNDIWIAASAMQHGFTLITMDKHFEQVPQILVNRIGAR